MAKEAYYFSHDANARNDPKICAMRQEFGAEGYGWYWVLVEMLREQDDYRLPYNEPFIWSAIAQQMQASVEQARAFVEQMVSTYKLFAIDANGEYFYSESLLRRMRKRAEISKQRSKAGKKGAKTRASSRTDDGQANAKQKSAFAEQTEAFAKQGKESKVKESKEKEIESATPLEQSILDELASVNGYPYDESKDLPHIRKLAADFPQIDLLREAKAWATYKLDKPLDAKSNPRSQFRTWCSRAKPAPATPQRPPQRQMSESSREYLRLVGAAPDSKEGQA